MEHTGETITANYSSYALPDDVTVTTANDHVIPNANIIDPFITLTAIAETTYDNSNTLPSTAELTYPTSAQRSDLHLHIARDGNEVDFQILLYVLAVVVFYGLLLTIALMGQRARRRQRAKPEDDHASLIDRNEVVRKDTVLRQKMNVLRLCGVQQGHMLDHIPSHEVWYVICHWLIHCQYDPQSIRHEIIMLGRGYLSLCMKVYDIIIYPYRCTHQDIFCPV